MEDGFEIVVDYGGKEQVFAASLQQAGYSYRILVDVGGVPVFFEPDEEKNFRAIIDPDFHQATVDVALIKAIAQSLETILK